MKTVYIPQYNSGMTEGRGPMQDEPFGFEDQADAERYIDQQPGIMGRRMKWSEEKYGDWQLKEIPIYESYRDFEDSSRANLRESALAKLTPEERAALGLS